MIKYIDYILSLCVSVELVKRIIEMKVCFKRNFKLFKQLSV